MRAAHLVATAVMLMFAGTVSAQRADSTDAHPPLVGRAAGRGGRGIRAGRQAFGGQANQQALARQVRQEFAAVVRRQLNLTDDQARQLQSVDGRFRQQRNTLLRDERQVRLGLAAAMRDSTTPPDQAKIAQYMDQLVQAQHRRATLLEAEQKELSAFLTPLQRAKYQSLNEQLIQRIRQMRQNARTGPVAPPPTR
jgi:Spy/CpxP family protein refolding chaperone